MSQPGPFPSEFDRYSRQLRFAPWSVEGQRLLARRRALVVGVGALGSVSAELLTRAGIGTLRLVDRDFLQLSNLQRQSLYDERDVELGLPKAIAAANRLGRINSSVVIEPHVGDINHRTLTKLAQDVDLIIDGTDNFETRFLVNDFSLQHGLPWIFGGCIGAQGQTLTIIPHQTICLRCLMPAGPPPADAIETCDTAGVLGPIVQIVGAVQAMEALKYLTGNHAALNLHLQVFSIWDNHWQQINVQRGPQRSNCPACNGREFPWLAGERGSQTQVLCGRNSVQIRPQLEQKLDLPAIARQWSESGRVICNEYLVKLQRDDFEISLFADGRAIIYGTDDMLRARTLYSQFVGH